MSYRYNLLVHRGSVSSLKHGAGGNLAKCYDELVDPVLFEVEAFKKNVCGHDDIWPCNPKDSHAFRENPPFFHPDSHPTPIHTKH